MNFQFLAIYSIFNDLRGIVIPLFLMDPQEASHIALKAVFQKAMAKTG
jgi:hypothetical protein